MYDIYPSLMYAMEYRIHLIDRWNQFDKHMHMRRSVRAHPASGFSCVFSYTKFNLGRRYLTPCEGVMTPGVGLAPLTPAPFSVGGTHTLPCHWITDLTWGGAFWTHCNTIHRTCTGMVNSLNI